MLELWLHSVSLFQSGNNIKNTHIFHMTFKKPSLIPRKRCELVTTLKRVPRRRYQNMLLVQKAMPNHNINKKKILRYKDSRELWPRTYQIGQRKSTEIGIRYRLDGAFRRRNTQRNPINRSWVIHNSSQIFLYTPAVQYFPHPTRA